jgi:hypothetical protein
MVERQQTGAEKQLGILKGDVEEQRTAASWAGSGMYIQVTTGNMEVRRAYACPLEDAWSVHKLVAGLSVLLCLVFEAFRR